MGKETAILLSICSILKELAYYWLPEVMGGSGAGYEVIKEFYPNLAEKGKTQHS
ncbi:MAG TPA: hypothetical protein VKZ42_03140 [Flavobacteriaceae bacterium]|nr:hypothetical protein [Flavobacteriaceae bacterium]